MNRVLALYLRREKASFVWLRNHHLGLLANRPALITLLAVSELKYYFLPGLLGSTWRFVVNNRWLLIEAGFAFALIFTVGVAVFAQLVCSFYGLKGPFHWIDLLSAELERIRRKFDGTVLWVTDFVRATTGF